MTPTEAEKHFDRLLSERRAKGRTVYGKGLDHSDAYDWNQMALEEAMDLSQYLAAENLRLRELLAHCLEVMDQHDRAHHMTCGMSFPMTCDAVRDALAGAR